MPIRIPNDLPAVKTLNDENIFVMTDTRATSQDIRPLKILVLNLMPKKIETETQLSRLLGNTPLQVELELIRTSTHQSKNTAAGKIGNVNGQHRQQTGGKEGDNAFQKGNNIFHRQAPLLFSSV